MIMTSESARVSDFSPHVIFAVKWHRVCDFTVAMIDKTSSGFYLCHQNNSLPSALILYRANGMLIKCVIDITQSSKTAWFLCLIFFVVIAWVKSLLFNQMI